jgi:hypothetical protein
MKGKRGNRSFRTPIAALNFRKSLTVPLEQDTRLNSGSKEETSTSQPVLLWPNENRGFSAERNTSTCNESDSTCRAAMSFVAFLLAG